MIPDLSRIDLSEPFSWRGYKMAAVRLNEGDQSVRIHLVDPNGGTLCGIMRMNIFDHDARTGWPDCEPCLKKSQPPKPSDVSLLK